MKMHSAPFLPERNRRTAVPSVSRRAWLWLLLLWLAALPGALRAADSFVEPLSGFEPVDSAVDPENGTNVMTFVLGRNSSGMGVLRRYDAAGGELSWSPTNVAYVRTLTGVTPTALFVGAGTINVYVVGGNRAVARWTRRRP